MIPAFANYLANLITGFSLAFGFVSILCSLEKHFTYACWAIIMSVIFDGIDGQIARKNPKPCDFGKELDSLVDVISFGIAPSILGYTFVYHDFNFFAPFALFFYLVCSVIRLAKYNVTPKDKLSNYFYGLPTTVSGGAVAAFILIYRRYTQSPPPVVFLLLVVIFALLMISKVRYANLENIRLLCRKPLAGFMVLCIVVLAVGSFYLATSVFLPEVAIFTLFVIYLISPFLLPKIV